MIVADILRDFGKDPDYWEDALTLPRLETFQRSLIKSPPLRWFAAGYFKYEAPDFALNEDPETQHISSEDSENLRKLFEPP